MATDNGNPINVRYILKELYNLIRKKCCENKYILDKEQLCIGVPETLLMNYLNHPQIENNFFDLFNMDGQMLLQRVHIYNNYKITIKNFEILCKHPLIELTIYNCSILTEYQIFYPLLPINKSGGTLRYIHISGEDPLDTYYRNSFYYKNTSEILLILPRCNLRHIYLPNLTILKLNNLSLVYPIDFNFLPKLNTLDYSNSFLENNCPIGISLKSQKLKILILHNVWPIECQLINLCQFHNLKKLDLSFLHINPQYGNYCKPEIFLRTLTNSLPELESLDISGTNLDGVHTIQYEPIIGLDDRLYHYLGLFNTKHNADIRDYLPSIMVAGKFTDIQLMTAIVEFWEHPELIFSVLKDMIIHVMFGRCLNKDLLLETIVLLLSDIGNFGYLNNTSAMFVLNYLIGNNIELINDYTKVRIVNKVTKLLKVQSDTHYYLPIIILGNSILNTMDELL